jgi:hypothetical protein
VPGARAGRPRTQLAKLLPGEIAGLKSLHDRHGRLGWAALFAPAIDLARNGFTQPQDVDDLIEGGAARLDAYDVITQLRAESTFLVKDPLWAETYAPNGTLATAGQTLYRKRLANALEVWSRSSVSVTHFDPSCVAHRQRGPISFLRQRQHCPEHRQGGGGAQWHHHATGTSACRCLPCTLRSTLSGPRQLLGRDPHACQCFLSGHARV